MGGFFLIVVCFVLKVSGRGWGGGILFLSFRVVFFRCGFVV